ncbi:sugar/nucleoside kinase (ribokinase family) [Paenibacillus wynnii]|nr:sugar/nucleoside kinase (ribokinase family) [Paenibacillus wynnii]
MTLKALIMFQSMGLLHQEAESVVVPGFEVTAIDTKGAGDAFFGGSCIRCLEEILY